VKQETIDKANILLEEIEALEYRKQDLFRWINHPRIPEKIREQISSLIMQEYQRELTKKKSQLENL
jgi:DNA-binding cell septation regulator SpoVG